MTNQISPVLIGIGGLLASGKDTVADYLVEHHGFIKMGMSEPLNDALLALNPYIPYTPTDIRDAHSSITDHVHGIHVGTVTRYQQLHEELGYTKAKENPEVRRLLQSLGTEVGRDMIDAEVWTTIAERKIITAMSQGKSVILTGIRFPNERDMILHNQGTLVWVDRTGPHRVTPGGLPAGTYSTVQHTSENTLGAGDFQVIMRNNSTLEALDYQTTEVLANITSNAVIRRPQPRITPVTWPPYDH